MEAISQYEFTATCSDELSFPKGAILKVSGSFIVQLAYWNVRVVFIELYMYILCVIC